MFVRSSARVVALALIVLVPVAVRADSDPLPEDSKKVLEIEWRGVSAIDEGTLEGAILTSEASRLPWKEARAFEEDVLEGDGFRVVSLYREHGYYDTAVETSFETAGDRAVRVAFQVAEGEPVQLAELSLQIVPLEPDLDRELLGTNLALVVGEVFSVPRYRESRERILNRLADLGYPAAELTGGADVTLETNEAIVQWTARPGPRVRLGDVAISGLTRVEESLVRQELSLEVGEMYSRSRLRAAQRALYDLGLFESVAIEARAPADGPERGEVTWPVVVRLRERKSRSLRFGAGFGTEDRLRARAEWLHRNFHGGRRSLRLKGKYSSLIQGLDVIFTQPRFLDWDTVLTLDSKIARETTPAFDSEGVSLGWQVERPLFEKLTARAGQRFELQKVTDVEAEDALVLEDEGESFRLSLLEFGLRWIDIDSVVNPTRGAWIDLSLEPSLKALGSELDYIRSELDLRAYRSLGATVLAGRLHLGVLEPLRDDGAGSVPIFKRFFSGGSASVRGFDLDQLGPLDDDEDPIGGLTVAEVGIELRFPLWKRLGGVVFTDAGQVNRRSFHLDGDDFFYSAGIGLRFATPIGPVRVDLAQILNPPSGVQPFRIHFSIGHAF